MIMGSYPLLESVWGQIWLLTLALTCIFGAVTVVRAWMQARSVRGPLLVATAGLLIALLGLSLYATSYVAFRAVGWTVTLIGFFVAIGGLTRPGHDSEPSSYVRKGIILDSDGDIPEPLMRDGNEMAIAQYIRLANLSGPTGLMVKLGITGLPLATVMLTLVFVIVELLVPGRGFMDLAKLTLGAFIGSFVQRSAAIPEAPALLHVRAQAVQSSPSSE